MTIGVLGKQQTQYYEIGWIYMHGSVVVLVVNWFRVCATIELNNKA